tara:strand:- start:743 stop:1018 length:276 start_codon:yes stop_codon:yes gene_type:complete
LKGEEVTTEVDNTDGRSPDWVMLQLRKDPEQLSVIDRLRPSIGNYQKLSAMIAGARMFAVSDREEQRLSDAYDKVIVDWTRFVHGSVEDSV